MPTEQCVGNQKYSGQQVSLINNNDLLFFIVIFANYNQEEDRMRLTFKIFSMNCFCMQKH